MSNWVQDKGNTLINLDKACRIEKGNGMYLRFHFTDDSSYQMCFDNWDDLGDYFDSLEGGLCK